MMLTELALIMILFSARRWMAQRETDLCLARSRCNSR